MARNCQLRMMGFQKRLGEQESSSQQANLSDYVLCSVSQHLAKKEFAPLEQWLCYSHLDALFQACHQHHWSWQGRHYHDLHPSHCDHLDISANFVHQMMWAMLQLGWALQALHCLVHSQLQSEPLVKYSHCFA